MPLVMNMKLQGITGDSRSFNHKGWSEVLSWNYGMTSNRKLPHENGSEKTSLNELSFVKLIGTDSPILRLFYAQGKIIPNAEFSIMPAVSQRETPTKYLHLVMEKVLIKSVITGGQSDENSFKEHVTLLFDRIRFEFSKTIPAASTGGAATTENFDFSWNIAGDEEWKV